MSKAWITHDAALPEGRLVSLEISLLHLSIDAKSEALNVDSWSSAESIFTGYDCPKDSRSEVDSVWMAMSDVNRVLFGGDGGRHPTGDKYLLKKIFRWLWITKQVDEHYPLGSPFRMPGYATHLQFTSKPLNTAPHKVRPLLWYFSQNFSSQMSSIAQDTSTILLPSANHY